MDRRRVLALALLEGEMQQAKKRRVWMHKTLYQNKTSTSPFLILRMLRLRLTRLDRGGKPESAWRISLLQHKRKVCAERRYPPLTWNRPLLIEMHWRIADSTLVGILVWAQPNSVQLQCSIDTFTQVHNVSTFSTSVYLLDNHSVYLHNNIFLHGLHRFHFFAK